MRCAVSAQTNAIYNLENITHVLQNGDKLGFTYIEFGSETVFKNISSAALGLQNPNVFEGRCIMAKREEMILDICIVPENNQIGILIGNFEIENLAVHINLFLSFVNGFAISEITTSID